MPEKLYELWLDERTYIHVEFTAVRGRIVSFVVRLMVESKAKWVNIVRYDTAHGVPHRDILDRRGRVVRKDWLLDMSFESALSVATDDLRVNYESYLDCFEGR